MVRLTILLILATATFTGCIANPAKETNEVYWVNSLNQPCDGVGKRMCLQVQKGETLEAGQWKLFYSNIEGFDYEQGYIYKLSVIEEQLPVEQVPADASSIRYQLVEVLEKNMDSVLRLNDIWALQTLNGKALVPIADNQRPSLELHLQDRRVMGTDGCNNFSGSIARVDSSTLEFGPLASTRKACMDMAIPDAFNQALTQTSSYEFYDRRLRLLDAEGNELMVLLKVD